MTLTSVAAFFGLKANASPTGTNIQNDNQIGVGVTQVALTDANVAYSTRIILAGALTTAVIDLVDNDTTGSTSWTAGTAQVETATAAGTISGSGNANVVVTSAGMTGSPITLNVAVLASDTAAAWAEKVRIALAANATIAARFTVSGASTAIVLTRRPSTSIAVGSSTVDLYPANDATLNIALDNGTCTGITTAATSANTTAGVATAGARIFDGDGKDWEGNTLDAITTLKGVLIQATSGSVLFEGPATANEFEVAASDPLPVMSSAQSLLGACTITAAADVCDITLTVIGKSA